MASSFNPASYYQPFQFIPSGEYKYPADSPVFYTPTIETRNILNDYLSQYIPQGVMANPYGSSPYLGSLQGTVQALQQAPHNVSGWSENPSLRRQGLLNIGNPAYRAAASAQPGLLNILTKLLMGSYQSGADIYASQRGGKSKREQIETEGDAARAGAFGQIPLIGGILGGLF